MDDSRGVSPAPLVSLVISSRLGGAALLACVESFARFDDDRFEVIVSECAEGTTADVIRARFPSVSILHFPQPRPIPDLRAAGLLAARGSIIAMTSEHCRAEDGWLQAVRSSHLRPVAAVGGAIENGVPGKLVDWAAFFCEYGRFMRPLTSGGAGLAGHNVSYTRDAVDAFADLLSPASWEPFWHRRLAERGLTVATNSSMVVSLHKQTSLTAFIAERYRYSRSFAGQRVAGRTWAVRLTRALATALLPPVLLLRLIRQILPKRRHRRELVASLPYLALFTIAWAAGECVGYLAGPGTSANQID